MKKVTLKITIRNEDEKLDLEVYEIKVKKSDVDNFISVISELGITDCLNEEDFMECCICGTWCESEDMLVDSEYGDHECPTCKS